MDFKEEDFPLYQALVKYQPDNSGVQLAIKSFNAAVSGGDEEKYDFAMGIQTVAVNSNPGRIQGTTQETFDKTLRSCFAVFSDVASRGHKDAISMRDYFIRQDLGQPEKPARKFSFKFRL
jgi:hypothetical protein